MSNGKIKQGKAAKAKQVPPKCSVQSMLASTSQHAPQEGPVVKQTRVASAACDEAAADTMETKLQEVLDQQQEEGRSGLQLP